VSEGIDRKLRENINHTTREEGVSLSASRSGDSNLPNLLGWETEGTTVPFVVKGQ